MNAVSQVSILGNDVDPDVLTVWVTGLAALVLTGQSTAWHMLRNVVTIAHEGGHAVAAVAARRRLDGIRLHSDTSGVTISRGRPRGAGMVLTAASGYPAPCVIGAGLAALIATDRTEIALWAVLVLLVALLTQIRNVFGAVSVVLSGAATFAAVWWGTPRVMLGFACAVAWLLLIGGGRAVIELQRTRSRQRGYGTTDADQLGRLTHLPGLLWVGVFLVVALAALVGGVRLLLLGT